MSMLRCFSALILFNHAVYHHKIPDFLVAPAIARFWCAGERRLVNGRKILPRVCYQIPPPRLLAVVNPRVLPLICRMNEQKICIGRHNGWIFA